MEVGGTLLLALVNIMGLSLNTENSGVKDDETTRYGVERV